MKRTTRNYLLLWLAALVSGGLLACFRTTDTRPFLAAGGKEIGFGLALRIALYNYLGGAVLIWALAAAITLVKVLSVGAQSVVTRNWKRLIVCLAALLAAYFLAYWGTFHFRFYGMILQEVHWRNWWFVGHIIIRFGFWPTLFFAALIAVGKLAYMGLRKLEGTH